MQKKSEGCMHYIAHYATFFQYCTLWKKNDMGSIFGYFCPREDRQKCIFKSNDHYLQNSLSPWLAQISCWHTVPLPTQSSSWWEPTGRKPWWMTTPHCGTFPPFWPPCRTGPVDMEEQKWVVPRSLYGERRNLIYEGQQLQGTDRDSVWLGQWPPYCVCVGGGG